MWRNFDDRTMFNTFAGGLNDGRESSELVWEESGVGDFPVGVGDFPIGVEEFPIGVGDFVIGVMSFSGDLVPFCTACDLDFGVALGLRVGSRLTFATCRDHVIHCTSHMTIM